MELSFAQIHKSIDDEYISKIVKTVEEAAKLAEVGFEFFCTAPKRARSL